MERRGFLAASCIAGLGALGAEAAGAQGSGRGRGDRPRRDIYELRRYTLDSEAQKTGLEAFFADAAIAALNRIEVSPVGVFVPLEGFSPVYVLLRHRNFWTFTSSTQRLLADEEFLAKGAKFLDAPATDPAYKRVESSAMVAFEGMPELEIPSKAESRILQLRIYESPSVKTGQKKIEMFNTGEIAIFRKVGLNPVFFGETVAGSAMPNLTYMLGFDNMGEREAAWKRFGGDPDWQKLRAIPDYADKKILSNITNIFLKPLSCSQI